MAKRTKQETDRADAARETGWYRVRFSMESDWEIAMWYASDSTWARAGYAHPWETLPSDEIDETRLYPDQLGTQHGHGEYA